MAAIGMDGGEFMMGAHKLDASASGGEWRRYCWGCNEREGNHFRRLQRKRSFAGWVRAKKSTQRGMGVPSISVGRSQSSKDGSSSVIIDTRVDMLFLSEGNDCYSSPRWGK